MGLVALQHVASSWTRDRTCVPCTGRRFLSTAPQGKSYSCFSNMPSRFAVALFADKGLYIKNYDFSSSRVQVWALDHKEGWGPKNWCFWIVMLEKTLESPWDSKEVKPVNPKGNEPWRFIGSTDAEAETPILWSPDAKRRLFGKDPDVGKDWGQEEKGATEMVRWHHWLSGHELEQTPGDGEGQGSLACCSPWGRKESDMTEQLNQSNKIFYDDHL